MTETLEQQTKRINNDYIYFRIQQLQELIKPLKKWEKELDELRELEPVYK